MKLTTPNIQEGRMKNVNLLLITAVLLMPQMAMADDTPTNAMAASNPTATPQTVSLYDQGLAASQANDFQKALPLFEQALRNDPNNPDILNMLAHTQRKIGLLDESLANYKKALDLRPNFPEAHEYLGEAYIQAALLELQVLKSDGGDAKEQVEDLTNFIKDAAQKS
jgi:tetratricopeptide (TPR) repeat protein